MIPGLTISAQPPTPAGPPSNASGCGGLAPGRFIGAGGRTAAVRTLGLAAVLLLISTETGIAQARPNRTSEPVIGLPCEGCEAVFDGLPDSLSSVTRIAPPDEPGEPMSIEGTVRDAAGRPVPGVIVYAYHTDARGVYPPSDRLRGAAERHGRLRAWAQTDRQGRYEFRTIRPASYPSRDTPAHVHMHVIEPGCCTYYIASIHFTDDPLLSRQERRELGSGRGGNGLVRPERAANGTWGVRRDIELGKGVPDYPGSMNEARPMGPGRRVGRVNDGS